MHKPERDAEHAGDDIAERELGGADADVVPELSGAGEIEDGDDDLRRRGEKERIGDQQAADKLPQDSPPTTDSVPARYRRRSVATN